MKSSSLRVICILAIAVASSDFVPAQTAFKVKGSTSDSLFVVQDDGRIGIGTANPQEQVDINGGIRIGNSVQTSNGTVRYSSGTFEGYSSGSWYSLNNEIYLLPPQIPTSSTVRDTGVDFTDTQFTIPATGWYLIVINARGTNNNSYQYTSGNYDEYGYIYMRNTADPPGLYYFLHDFFVKNTDQNDPSLTFRYISFPISHSFVRQFSAGTQIVVGAIVGSTGAVSTSWNISSINGHIVRLK